MDRAGKKDTTGRKRRGGPQRPTVADVAVAACVSPMTVSRVINGKSNVLPRTRAKVEEAIVRLGFVPNQAAQNLAGGKACRIGLLYSNPSAAYLSEFLMGSLSQASSENAQLVVEYSEGGLLEDDLIQRLLDHRIDAVLVPPPLCDDSDLLDRLRGAGLAMVQIATGLPSPKAHSVTIDDKSAAHKLTRLLIDMGHRRIAFIAGDPNQTASALRQEGYETALSEAGVGIDQSLIVPGNFTYRSGLEAAERLLSRPMRPTAIVASNDDMAAAAVAVAHRHRLDVPGDLSVCGFDDTAMATTIWPELTTVRQPIADMARRATSMLIQDVTGSGEERPGHVRLDFELILRGSHGPPPR